MNIEIRFYEDSDYEQVNHLLEDTFHYQKSKISDPNVYEFVAVFEDKIVGYFNLGRMLDVIRNIVIFHVDYVCVSEELRGKKIGRKMMEYAIDFAKEKGATRMELTSGNQRIAAHKLYEGLGFVKRDSSIFRKELL